MVQTRAKNPPSILQRAVALLARREHSRAELARRLARYRVEGDDPAQIDAVLDQLELRGMLSNERFAAALTRSRGARFGTERIRQEMRQHGLEDELVQHAVDALRATEYERARKVWRKKFDARAHDEAERARQIRFLTSRGFAVDVILRVIKGDPESDAG